jgi:hypothetical protein
MQDTHLIVKVVKTEAELAQPFGELLLRDVALLVFTADVGGEVS